MQQAQCQTKYHANTAQVSTQQTAFLTLQAILRATKSSFAAMKKRLAGISNASASSAERPFFDVSVELTVPKVTMNPTLDDIQAAINATAKKVAKASCLLLLGAAYG